MLDAVKRGVLAAGALPLEFPTIRWARCFGIIVLHVTPDAASGGPLALVRTGDTISVDVAERSIRLEVPEAELARRRAEWTPPPPRYGRGYGWMFAKHIEQADKGCDFDFLKTGFGPPVAEPDIF
jgi:dihydroxyacid dehydratase/phosphogluconate dehydratase